MADEGIADPAVVTSGSDYPFPRLSDDELYAPPIMPPAPRPDGEPICEDPTAMMVYEVATGRVTEIPSDHPSQLPVESGVNFVPPYEGLLPPGLIPETVFPPDDRERVTPTTGFPWRTVCKLYITAADNTNWIASGVIIGRLDGHSFHIYTAGHCVYIHDHGGWVQSIRVLPGFDNGAMPYNYAWGTTFRTYSGWVNNRMTEHDWAVVTLDRRVGNVTGWMGRVTYAPDDPVYTGMLNLAGYPGDLMSGLCMYWDSDYGCFATEYNHWYRMDMAGGMSGGPVWVYFSSSGDRYIATINTYHDDGTGCNHGTRLDTDKFNRTITWIDSDTPPVDRADLKDRGQAYAGFSPGTIRAGQPFTVWSDTLNVGTAYSGGFQVTYYASVDTTITTGDYYIGTDSMPSIPGLQTSGAPSYADSSWSGPFPCSIPPGTYYVGWIIDSAYQVSEFDETDNTGYDNARLTVTGSILSTSVNPAGSGSVSPSGGSYPCGTNVILTATPANACWRFSHWSGDASGNTNPVTITMNCDKSVTANFVKVQYGLTATVNPAGSGSISLNPPGGTYDCGTRVCLTPIPNACWQFSHWSGDASGTDVPLCITMDGNKNIVANFVKVQYSLTATVNPPGSGGIMLYPPGGTYDCGTKVCLLPIPSTCWGFSHWSGDASGNTAPLCIIMDSNKNIVANFVKIKYSLAVAIDPPTCGTVVLEPPGNVYDCGTTVQLTAVPVAGASFIGWSGDLSGNANPETIVMDSDKAVTAHFTPCEGWCISLTTSSTCPGQIAPVESMMCAVPGATSGFDQDCDIPLPPPGMPPYLDVYFEGVPPFDRLGKDCREYLDPPPPDYNECWTFHAYTQNDSNCGFTICWDTSDFLDYASQYDLGACIRQLDPPGPTVDMLSQPCFGVTLEEGIPYTFSICVGIICVDVPLCEGWNMISWPGEPIPSNVDDIVAGNPDVLPYFYTWDSGIGGYVTVSEVKCGDGYWVAATQDCLLEICYIPVYELTRELAKGWNMIGSIACAVPVNSLTSSPPSYHLPYVYTWDCSIGGYELVDYILPTVGHWIAAIDICDLTMSCPASPLVESQPSVDAIAPTWKSTVSVEGQELAFGMHLSASDGFDRLLDKPLPPPPVTASDDVKNRGGKKLNGIVKAGWVIADTTFPMLSDSYVKESTQGIWELSVELPKPGKIEWSDLPEGYRCILYYGKRSVNMNPKKFLPLPAGEYNLTLVLDALSSLPKKTEVLANYPNPFNPETWIPYRLSEDGDVTLIIRDVSGREVRRFHLGRQLAGEYLGKEQAIYWDGRNESGELVSSGVYFYTLQAGISITRKLVVVR